MKGNEVIFNENRKLLGNKTWRLICALIAIVFFVANTVKTGATGAITMIPFLGLFAYGLDGISQRLRGSIQFFVLLIIGCTVISLHGIYMVAKARCFTEVDTERFTQKVRKNE